MNKTNVEAIGDMLKNDPNSVNLGQIIPSPLSLAAIVSKSVENSLNAEERELLEKVRKRNR